MTNVNVKDSMTQLPSAFKKIANQDKYGVQQIALASVDLQVYANDENVASEKVGVMRPVAVNQLAYRKTAATTKCGMRRPVHVSVLVLSNVVHSAKCGTYSSAHACKSVQRKNVANTRFGTQKDVDANAGHVIHVESFTQDSIKICKLVSVLVKQNNTEERFADEEDMILTQEHARVTTLTQNIVVKGGDKHEST